jgi:branched-chain amino acid aminotransferase
MRTDTGWICINGCLLEPESATVSVLDSGFLLGDGLFESLRATDGRPYLLNRHLRRLFAAAAEYEFTDMPPVESVEQQVHETLARAALAEAYVRVTITRGTGAIGLAPPQGPPTVVVAVLPTRPPPQPEETVAVTLLPAHAHRTTPAKSVSWQHVVLARRSVEKAGADEGIYLSENGHVLEAVASNVFVVADEQLLTPRVKECLPGITRARIIELARGRGIPVREVPVEVGVLRAADEVFLTNSVQGLRAVDSIDGITIGNPSPTSTFATLHALYEQDRLGIVWELT